MSNQVLGQDCEEVTNEHGFIDYVLIEDGERQYYTKSNTPITVCPGCMAMVMPNLGHGCLCTSCNNDLDVECEHDENDLIF